MEEAKRRLRAILEYNRGQREADAGRRRDDGRAVAVEGLTDQAREPMTWQEAQEKLLGMVEHGEAYTSVQKLADRLGCSSSTVHKAIADSRRLKRWQAEGSRTQGAPKAQSLNRAAEDGKPGKGPDPAEVVEENDLLDNVFARLLNEATEEERAALNAKPLSEQRELARAKLEQEKDQAAQESGPERNDPAYRDPKRRGNRLLGRKP
jgi:predicted transcriptional regulator